jgi:hypothetical protein
MRPRTKHGVQVGMPHIDPCLCGLLQGSSRRREGVRGGQAVGRRTPRPLASAPLAGAQSPCLAPVLSCSAFRARRSGLADPLPACRFLRAAGRARGVRRSRRPAPQAVHDTLVALRRVPSRQQSENNNALHPSEAMAHAQGPWTHPATDGVKASSLIRLLFLLRGRAPGRAPACRNALVGLRRGRVGLGERQKEREGASESTGAMHPSTRRDAGQGYGTHPSRGKIVCAYGWGPGRTGKGTAGWAAKAARRAAPLAAPKRATKIAPRAGAAAARARQRDPRTATAAAARMGAGAGRAGRWTAVRSSSLHGLAPSSAA